MLDEIRKRLQNLRQEPAKFSVHCDETGLTQIVHTGNSTQTRRVDWDGVTRVFAYKRDCFSVDQICIVIGTADDQEWIEPREDDEGYESLISQMPIRMVGWAINSSQSVHQRNPLHIGWPWVMQIPRTARSSAATSRFAVKRAPA
jgi:hypothetical protein